MSKGARAREKDGDIITFYYLIFGNRVRKGMSQAEARKEACDAVTLRYGISKGRMLNIISERKSSRSANTLSFQQNALALIDDLITANKELDAVKEKNERLIGLLKECLNGK